MTDQSSKFWSRTTLLSLFIGYCGYYLCRSNLSIAAPLIIREYSDEGITKEVIGQISSVGLIFYVIGKVINGLLGDYLGGRKIFIWGMLGAVLATAFFSLGSGIAVFITAWSFNRFIQSMGWGGLVKTTSNWISYKSYGKAMAFLSLSYLVGDIAAKLILGELVNYNLSWQQLFYVSGAMLLIIAIIISLTLKDKPEEIGLTAPESNPASLFAEADNSDEQLTFNQLIRCYFKSKSFWLVLTISFGLTGIREAFNFWLPTYLFESAALSEGQASKLSSLYPLCGVGSILLAGYLSDTVFKGKRGLMIVIATVSVSFLLPLMAHKFETATLPLVLISAIGLLLLGPYSLLAGAISLDLGGKKGASTASGIIDAVGYTGGTLTVWLTGVTAEHQGWSDAFKLLAVLAIISALAALVFYWRKERIPNSLVDDIAPPISA
ncbi:MFS transporter [Solitalea lacus]|uniref:MFS transporter n=1 Tax=Solitalea lacus TaxID=2911172 RepID=UPI001EDC2686|nr:MFS transporter [Solitalea lacus]UKJ08166.1 MFS transporter [Solitalea lacus]